MSQAAISGSRAALISSKITVSLDLITPKMEEVSLDGPKYMVLN